MLSTSALIDGANAINAAITHLGLSNGAPGAAGTSNAVGTRVANSGSVNASGVITRNSAAFTGLTANQAVTHVTYWTAATGGTYKGASALTGDTAANSAGEFTVTAVTETPSAT